LTFDFSFSAGCELRQEQEWTAELGLLLGERAGLGLMVRLGERTAEFGSAGFGLVYKRVEPTAEFGTAGMFHQVRIAEFGSAGLGLVERGEEWAQ